MHTGLEVFLHVIFRLSRHLASVPTRLLALLLLPFRLPLLGRPTATVDGFRVYVHSEGSHKDAIIRQLAAALELVRATDSRRFVRIRADAPRLYVSDFLGAAGYWWTWPTAITFDATSLLEQPVLWAASTLAHEGTHARLRRAGVHTTAANRARVERRCVSEELDLLHRVPEQHRDEARRWIAWSKASLLAPAPWYEPATRRADLRKALAARGAPEWLLWFFGRDRRATQEGHQRGGT